MFSLQIKIIEILNKDEICNFNECSVAKFRVLIKTHGSEVGLKNFIPEHVLLFHIFRENDTGCLMDIDRRSCGHILHEILFVLEKTKKLATQDRVIILPRSESRFLSATLQLMFPVDIPEVGLNNF